MDLVDRLRKLEQLPAAEHLAGLVQLADTVRERPAGDPERVAVIRALVAAVESEAGNGHERLAVGEALGVLGDPRLRRPEDPDYWVTVPSDLGAIVIGRYPVTNQEFRSWVAAGGYSDRAAWSEEGWAWLQGAEPWPAHADDPSSGPFVVPNQPVVGVSLHEAMAFAAAHQARLPRSDERMWCTRGRERRPYPWGSPFGEGNANTSEEGLRRPSAVGLYRRDRTPEGVCDLAGNVAEWMADEVTGFWLAHPGAFDQPSLASWAKASVLRTPDERGRSLGFRLARDHG